MPLSTSSRLRQGPTHVTDTGRCPMPCPNPTEVARLRQLSLCCSWLGASPSSQVCSVLFPALWLSCAAVCAATELSVCCSQDLSDLCSSSQLVRRTGRNTGTLAVSTWQAVSDSLPGPVIFLLIILPPGPLVVFTWQYVSDSLPGPAVSLLIILLPGTLVVLTVCEWFTTRSSCPSSHNPFTWHSGCIDLIVCEWFTVRSSCFSSHNLSTWHFGCINLTDCEWFTARSSCSSSHNSFTWHSDSIDSIDCEWFTGRSSCISFYNYSVWHTGSIVLKLVCEWVYTVSLFMIFTLTLVLFNWQLVSGFLLPCFFMIFTPTLVLLNWQLVGGFISSSLFSQFPPPTTLVLFNC